jgi:hypothetical protein
MSTMWFFHAALLATAVTPGLAFAANTRTIQFSHIAGCNCQPAREPNCEAPQRAPEPPPQQAPQPPLAAVAPPGMFVQPPASGTVFGPVEQRGVEGASITFPSFTLRCPTIRFPAMFQTRTNARMEIDSASAPYVQGYPAAAALAPVAMAPSMAFSPQVPTQPQQSPQQPQPPAAAPEPRAPQAPSCDGPRAPSCDHALLEQRLRTLEQAEQRLMQRLAQLQSGIEASVAAQAGPAPAAIRTASSPIDPNLRPTANYAPAPTMNRLPPAADTQRAPQVQPRYIEQPASYIQEPQRLPPTEQWIREPQAPSGRITGLRPLGR